MKGWVLAGLALIPIFASGTAHAARPGTVDADEATLYEGPGSKYKMIEKLPKGTPVSASNVPTEGYFKVRTGNGSVGWISGDALVLQSSADTENPDPLPVPAPQMASTPTPAAPVQTPMQAEFRRKPRKQYVRVRGLGGGTLFNMKDVNTLIGFVDSSGNPYDTLKYGYQYGFQMDFLWSSDLAMTVRTEWMRRSALGVDNSTKDTIQFDVKSLPVMVGVNMTLTQEGKLATYFAIMGGLAINTELDATDKSQTGNNVTSMSAQAFTGLAKLEADFSFSRVIGLYIEAGYRYLKTVQVTPDPTQLSNNGAQILIRDKNFVPVSLDLSGPVLGAGITFTF